MESLTSLAILLSICLILRWLRNGSHIRLPLPPGPKGYPIIGNMLDIPGNMPWKTFKQWSTIHGDVMLLNSPGISVVVLGSARAAFDLLEKRSDIYSDRPASVMTELMSWDWATSLMPYSQRWRDHRREFHQFFNQREVPVYRPIHLAQSRACLVRLLTSQPDEIAQNIRQTFTSTILKLVYDIDAKDLQDEYVRWAQIALQGASTIGVLGLYWVENFPILRHIPGWVPGAYFRKRAEYYKPAVDSMRNKPFDKVKQDMLSGKATSCLASSLLERHYQRSRVGYSSTVNDDLPRDVAGIAYAAAADTSTSAAQSFLIAMSLYPDIQRKAQNELDSVVGSNRLPAFDDYDNLVYIQAIVLETMRWIPVTPLGVHHRVIRDDEYRGYLIPKGALVVVSIWALLHNPEDYPDPESFKPERFLKDGVIDPAVRDPLTLAFGFGRRICPGRYFSQDALFMMIASILHTFNVVSIIGEGGSKFDPETEVTAGFIVAPSRVPCTVTPRSKKAETLIRQVPSNTEGLQV